MGRPEPTWAYHFTHVSNLASIARDGLVCDAIVHAGGRLTTEVGYRDIKARRRRCPVAVGPGGVVADYVPFYFGRRGPMLYNIHTGRVPTYQRGQNELAYLCTTVERVVELGLPWVASDRNASDAIAHFVCDLSQLNGHVRWDVVGSTDFAGSEEEPDRPKQHQAELLVHQRVPWEAIMFVGARNAADLERVEQAIGSLGGHQPRRVVRPGWYF